MALRPRSFVLVTVLGLAAITLAAVLAVRPPLTDARDAADARWAELRSELDARYDRLGALAAAVAERRDDLTLPEEIAATRDRWSRTRNDLDAGPAAANALEGLGVRLATIVVSSASLSGDATIVDALRNYLSGTPTAAVDTFASSVRKYDQARSRFPGRFFSRLLGFDTVRSVHLPSALDGIEVPRMPAPEPPEPGEADAATTTTTAPEGASE